MMARIAIPVEEGYEDLEVHYPRLRFIEEGFTVKVASPDGNEKISKHGYPIKPDMKTSQLKTKDFDAVIIHGGIKGAEKLRMDTPTVNFVKDMYDQGKIVAAICHGPWVLISAFIVKGKNMTSYVGIKDDLIAAGANYTDKEVVNDNNLITSRKPADLPAFVRIILKKLAV